MVKLLMHLDTQEGVPRLLRARVGQGFLLLFLVTHKPRVEIYKNL